MKTNVAVFVTWLACSLAQAADLSGVPRVVDGDTLAIGATKVRLEGIDAPETDQICLNANGVRWTCGIDARDRAAGRDWSLTGKLKIAGGVEGPMRESINRAFAYLMGQKVKMGVGQEIDTTDFHVESIDLLSNHVPCEPGIALVVAVYSAIKRQSVQAGLVILGDLSIQGNIKSVRSLAEPLQVAMDNGARRALVPLENKRHFLEVSGDIVERVDPIFFSDPMTAAMKALGIT
jgi:ATP-dependent Lon protease